MSDPASKTTRCIHPDACRDRGECMLFGCDRYPATATSSPKNDVDRIIWDRLVAGAIAKIEALPKWKRDSLRAQVAAMGKGESNVR
jgi:hypothetical protein